MDFRISLFATFIGFACAFSHVANHDDHLLLDFLSSDVPDSTEGAASLARREIAAHGLHAPSNFSTVERRDSESTTTIGVVSNQTSQNKSALKQPAPHDETLKAEKVLHSHESSHASEASSGQKEQNAQRAAGGHSKLFNNLVFFGALAFVALATLLGNRVAGERGWSFGMLGSSYLLLIPGIIGTLFSADIILKLSFGVLPDVETRVTPNGEPIAESMIGLIRELANNGGWFGAALVVTYAMVIPAMKLVLLFVGEKLRNSNITSYVEISRTCINIVQVISKWASPDLFAYMLLLYLIRVIKSEPLVAMANLDVGFICFGVFCIFSTISSLAIKLPDVPRRSGTQEKPWLQLDNRCVVALLIISLECIFGFLFIVGSTMPCMALHFNAAMLVQPNGPLPAIVKPVLESVLGDKLSAEASLLDCVTGYLSYVADGEMSTLLGFFMLAVFVMLFTVLDMLLLLLAVVYGSIDGPVVSPVLRFVKHLNMLDVFVMGVVVVCLAAGTQFKEKGIEISMQTGLWMLIGAEVVHRATHYVVRSNAHLLQEEELGDKNASLVQR